MTRLELIMNDARRPLGPDDVEALLKRVQRPEAPTDMLAQVRARLAAEKAASRAQQSDEPGLAATTETDDVIATPWLAARPEAAAAEVRAPSRWRRFAGEGLLAACAVIALVVAVQLGERMPRGANPAAEAAGIAGEDGAIVDVQLVSTGVSQSEVARLAQQSGLSATQGPEGVAYEGGAHDVRRFLVSLRVAAAKAGGDVKGFVPEAGRLRISVRVD